MTPAFHDNEGPPLVGYFTYSLVGDQLVLVGRDVPPAPGSSGDEVTPCRPPSFLLTCHPDDRPGVYEVLDNAMRAATPFACYHRVIDRDGQEHSVLLVGRGVRDDRGLVERLEGYVVDIAPRPFRGAPGADHADPRSEVESSVAWGGGLPAPVREPDGRTGPLGVSPSG